MKKLLSIVLVLAMVLPLTLVAQAEETEIKPFYGLSWSEVDESKCDNVIKAYTINLKIKKERVTMELPGVSVNVDKIAAAVKKEMDRRKEGMRYLHFFGPADAFSVGAENVIYLDKGVGLTKDLISEFIQKYHAIGGKLDGIVLDLEYLTKKENGVVVRRGTASYEIYGEYYNTNREIYNDIVNDPRYATELRPMLEERGFLFYENPEGQKSEIYSIYPYDNNKVIYPNARNIWDNVMYIRLANYLEEAFYNPIKALYPDIILSDYSGRDTYAWNKDLGGSGVHDYLGGNSQKTGNISCYVTYGTNPSSYFWYSNGQPSGNPIYSTVPGYNKAIFEDDPFNMFMWDVNHAKNIFDATDTKRFTVWIAEYNYNEKREGSVSNTPYYTETILHMGLLNPEPFLVYMYRPHLDSQEEYDECVDIISQILDELTRVVGAADRKPIETPATWNDGFILSGMYAGGRNVWRITPDTTDGMTLENFKVKDDVPTFSINGKTITFPQGKIVADGAISKVGTCGYWIETPADVVPVIETDADRWDRYSVYHDGFEDYEEGAEITGSAALPRLCWQIESSITPKIVSVNNNKAMALVGTATLKNLNIPQNVTAGDHYAKNQSWEVSFTLSSDLGDRAELVLLSSGSDGGFKIAGGKVHYDEAGTYKEMSGVTLSADKKYTVRREMDFANAGSFTCDYTVFDENGKQIGQVKDVPIRSLGLPVASIDFACKNVAGQVLLDDYKLYLEGVTTDFELYDAATGRLLTDATEERTADTAYRLAWVNATRQARKAHIYAGSELVTTIEMAAGDSGIATGIIAVESGKSVAVRLEVEEVVSEGGNDGDTNGTEGTTDTTETEGTTGTENSAGSPDGDLTPEPGVKNGLSGGQIALIAVVVIVLVGGVVTGVHLSKKKKSTEELIEDNELKPENDSEMTE